MAHLSRIPLAPLRDGARRLLRSPQAMHAAVLGAVAYHPDAGRTLWRLDGDSRHRPYLYAVTQVAPDWTALVEQAGWVVDDPNAKPVVADYGQLLAQLQPGQAYGFRLTASPVETSRAPQKPTKAQADHIAAATGGKVRAFRMGHRTAHHQLAWFTNRVKGYGFEIREVPDSVPAAPSILPLIAPAADQEPVLDVRVTARDRCQFTKNDTGSTTGSTTVTITTATYEGTLTVTDPVALARTLLTGIGPAKAYGCGLLTLAPTQ
ncbi:type I-E CRISPR-associated protein Cas6/Cse3/CasE [Streptomyces sp. ZAF1911]|uniref:type I-E CRISPR-associated protein Cas6/Cse3/CasE n=1 Tax=Streptomyces sp. ZAF1911 TaxID=2944129 RepID=UPI00237C2ED3|nr:type I-E CRISPR-associated protein Cas6/Cse3/CasE [Streptomyces sp. ZAF1911]MDD9380367.1 type I-E CRISPR-associated protein Cas6/Cse3/CasE [Streptomyces sp. ZAF1911]